MIESEVSFFDFKEIEENLDEFIVVKGAVVSQRKAVESGSSSQVNWTFPEAFNIILHEQSKLVQDFCQLDDRFQQLVLAIWVSFLEVTEVGFEDNVKSSKMPKLQMIMRARDLAVIVDKKENITYPGRKAKVYTNSAFRIGSKVMHRIANDQPPAKPKEIPKAKRKKSIKKKKDKGQEPEGKEHKEDSQDAGQSTSMEADVQEEPVEQKPLSLEEGEETLDPKSFLIQHSNPKRNQSRKTKSEYQRIYKFALKKFDVEDQSESEEERIERQIHEEEKKINYLDNAEERAVAERQLQEMKKRSRMSSITKKLEEITEDDSLRTLSNKRKRSYCRTLASSMTSCKTLGIIYLAIRILDLNIFAFDIVRWINHGHIPFFNTFQLLPSNWNFIINDFHSLNSLYSPQPHAINQHATNIANLIGIKELKVPSMRKLIFRFIDDLNLPYLLSDLIVNLFEQRFKEERKVRELVKKSIEEGGSIPEYESIALAIIVLTLKKLFGVNGVVEKDFCRRLKRQENNQNLFIWTEWEAHTRLKMESIGKHFFPAFDQNVEELENLDLMYNYYKKVVHIENKPDIASKKKKLDKDAFLSLPNVFKNILQSDLEFNSNETANKSNEILKPDLFPLKSLTSFILKNYDPRNYELLCVDFRNKSISYLFEDLKQLPDDFRLINMRIFCLDKIEDWSDSFKYLIKLCCFILNKREHSFLDKLYYVENSVFRHYNSKKSSSSKK